MKYNSGIVDQHVNVINGVAKFLGSSLCLGERVKIEDELFHCETGMIAPDLLLGIVESARLLTRRICRTEAQ